MKIEDLPPEYVNGSKLLKCVTYPLQVHSEGILGSRKPPLTYSLPVLELQLVTIFSLTQLLHFPLKHLGLPRILSEIMAGVILGPTFLGQYSLFQKAVFQVDNQDIVGTFSSFGFTMFMFIIGVKMDVTMIKRTGGKAWVIGLLNGFIPLITILLVVVYIERSQGNKRLFEGRESGLIVIAVFATTSFAVIAQLLKDVKIINSELGRLALSSALISNLFGTTLTAIMQFLNDYYTFGLESAMESIGLCVAFLCLAVFVFRPLMFWAVEQTPKGRAVNDLYIFLIVIGALISAVFTHYINLLAPFGSFLFGLVVPEGPPLGTTLIDKIDSYSSGILLPLFVSYCTLKTDLSTGSFKNPLVLNNFILSAVTFFSKVFACLLPALYCKMPFMDALTLSLIMSAKGIVDLAKYNFLRDQKIFSQPIFAIVVVATTLNVSFLPLLVRCLYDPSRKYAGYQKRNIMHANQSMMLPIFVCIHRQDNILPITRVLDATCHSTKNPINVSVLHLIELCGRASPIFISHKLQKKSVANISYSENVIVAFNEFERNHKGSAIVQTFTAISSRQFMHEDICSLALDTLAALIIIPFHKQWSKNGLIVVDDLELRMLNLSVMERAPCSVGILVDRGCLPIIDVAIVFLGGSDDQEALVYAKRMTKNPNITLTIVHLISVNDEREFVYDKERIVETEMLNEMKMLYTKQVRYIETRVKGGDETTVIIQGMVNEYDLIIVGRHKNAKSSQTSGLELWSEYTELGEIGDLLASSDLKGKASILVLQQQQMNC